MAAPPLRSAPPAGAPTALGGAGPLGGSPRRAAVLTATLGLVHVALFLLAAALAAGVPGPRAPDAALTAFYAGPERRRLVLVWLYLMPFAGIAFLWFVVALRMWVSDSARRENVLFSTVQLVSGILFLALFFGGAAATATTALSVELSASPVDPVVARQLPLLGNTLLLVFAMRMAAVFVFSTSTLGRTTGVLPRWFAVAGYPVGAVLLLSATFSPALVLVFPGWVLVLSVLLLLRARHLPADPAPAAPAAPAAPQAGRS
jgi:hypothetical protein